MDLSQTKLVGLTMQLELKAREYNELCNELEQLKKSNINPNDVRLLKLEELFQQNQAEIVRINEKLKELKQADEIIEKQKLEKYKTDNLFKNKKHNSETVDMVEVKSKKNVFAKLIEKIKSFFAA